MILLLFPLTVFVSCDLKHKPNFNKHLIENISQAQTDLPSQYSGIIFFCKSQNNRILPVNANDFRFIYSKEYNKLDYKSFITKLLNQEIDIQYNQENSFEVNIDVENKYKSLDFNSFMDLYCVKVRNSHFTLKKNVLKSQRNSIFYFLFINNYLTGFDDYKGQFIIAKNE